METLTVFILCGGKSSRMQSEKGLVLFQEKPFIEHIIQAILPITNNIKLVTASKEYDYLKYEKIPDLIIDKGPLGGIYTALSHSETEFNLILSCDIPLISTELLQELISKHTQEAGITVFASDSKTHPLIGIYSKEIVPIIKKAIDSDELRMMDLLARVPHQIIKIEESENFHLTNINSADELNDLNINLS
ncbi:molybdenum cofactor guanylyltransferase [Flavobacterium nitrogenifigens]|uniref:Probable molybdenum cofactor guanylyltransferase n=1 Tax=Flavobacterium nitrogenifigens TaxID=1617283 RepID=A0A521DUP8_9FLAO|nr:molybdenum cofactor guanylyltransferase [Flavobacterium nitrogenifigens]KAF2327569.1 molybdenum cofactor guanylyltransferase [Flavobacterium nitrogenifigens]SMO75358.1 molybdenum cofactor guanylyltransferase [Flavobacterium nitrogenifigens]